MCSTSEQLKFWANYVSGPQEWVFCGSALSSEEKVDFYLILFFHLICRGSLDEVNSFSLALFVNTQASTMQSIQTTNFPFFLPSVWWPCLLQIVVL